MYCNNFYFDVEIWGTVSDWIMVVVTALTAYFLVLTFRQQQRLFKNELYKHKLLIKPHFKAKLIKFKKTNSSDINYIIAEIEIEAQNHRLFLDKIVIRTKQILKDSKDYQIQSLKRNFEVGTTWCCILQYNELQNYENHKIFVSPEILIFFTDIEGNNYQQQLNFRTLPELDLHTHPTEERNEELYKQWY